MAKISVVVTAYNHEKYIGQCLDSILQQKGNYTLEIILGDDCSVDRTRQIMQEYHEKHPDIFILLPKEANLGIPKNIKRCLDACTGDYIAFCEGDDYWTDSSKLQKLSNFLESHTDCSLCAHRVMLYFEESNRFEPHREQLSLKKDTITTQDLIVTNYICGFSSCMYRSSIVRQVPAAIFDISIADWMFNMACGKLGKIGLISSCMSVYRIHAKGTWGGKSPMEQKKELLSLIDIYNEFFSYEFDEQFRKAKNNLKTEYLPAQQQGNFLQKCYCLLMRAIRNPHKVPDKVYGVIKTRMLIMGWALSIFRHYKIGKLKKMNPLKLNVGCGKIKLDGWVNVDIEPNADLVMDVRKGLPFDNDSVDFVYNEHFLEHLTYEEGIKFLRESYRCLKNHGVLRVAIPDLDYVVRKYNDDWANQDWLTWPGFKFIKTRGMMINVSFRYWGHQYLYNEEDLRYQLLEAGFKKVIRCDWNVSTHPELTGLETRKDSILVIETEK